MAASPDRVSPLPSLDTTIEAAAVRVTAEGAQFLAEPQKELILIG